MHSFIAKRTFWTRQEIEVKEFRVIAGPKHDPTFTRVQLNGVLPDEPLTPKLARQAARAARADVVVEANHKGKRRKS